MSIVSSLVGVDPRLVLFWEDFKKGIPSAVIYESKRSVARQAKLYWACKRGTGSCPAAPPGRSAHQYGKALDINGFSPEKDKAKIESVLKRHPFIEWGGNWKGKTNDPPHFQIRNWRKEVELVQRIEKGDVLVWLVIVVVIIVLLNL